MKVFLLRTLMSKEFWKALSLIAGSFGLGAWAFTVPLAEQGVHNGVEAYCDSNPDSETCKEIQPNNGDLE